MPTWKPTKQTPPGVSETPFPHRSLYAGSVTETFSVTVVGRDEGMYWRLFRQ
jgi:hypothetical protein